MAANKFSKSKHNSGNGDYAVLEVRKKISDMYLAGKPQFEIAKVLGVTQPNISYHLGKIKEEWLKSCLQDFDAAKCKELAKIDRVEEVAWESFWKSCKNAVTVESKKGVRTVRKKDKGGEEQVSQELGPVEEKKTVKGQAGDPRFLELVMKCINDRCKILGIHKDAPASVNQLVINFDQLYGKPEVDDPVERRIVEARQVQPLPVHTNGKGKK